MLWGLVLCAFVYVYVCVCVPVKCAYMNVFDPLCSGTQLVRRGTKASPRDTTRGLLLP